MEARGLWLTVNTPKELRQAAEQVEAHPDWRRAVTGGALSDYRFERAGSRSPGGTS